MVGLGQGPSEASITQLVPPLSARMSRQLEGNKPSRNDPAVE